MITSQKTSEEVCQLRTKADDSKIQLNLSMPVEGAFLMLDLHCEWSVNCILCNKHLIHPSITWIWMYRITIPLKHNDRIQILNVDSITFKYYLKK